MYGPSNILRVDIFLAPPRRFFKHNRIASFFEDDGITWTYPPFLSKFLWDGDLSLSSYLVLFQKVGLSQVELPAFVNLSMSPKEVGSPDKGASLRTKRRLMDLDWRSFYLSKISLFFDTR